jgi:hypothetical protein
MSSESTIEPTDRVWVAVYVTGVNAQISTPFD